MLQKKEVELIPCDNQSRITHIGKETTYEENEMKYMTDKEKTGVTLKRSHLVIISIIVVAMITGGITLGLN